MIYHGMIYHIYRGLLDIPRRLGYFSKNRGIPRLFSGQFFDFFFYTAFKIGNDYSLAF